MIRDAKLVFVIVKILLNDVCTRESIYKKKTMLELIGKLIILSDAKKFSS